MVLVSNIVMHAMLYFNAHMFRTKYHYSDISNLSCNLLITYLRLELQIGKLRKYHQLH